MRNWDYRYTWVRDAAFTVYSLMRLGYTEEAGAFAEFMQARAKEEEPAGRPLNVMYGIDGRHDSRKRRWTTWMDIAAPGRCASATPRYGHLQLDIYGELMDALYLYDKYGAPLSYDMWTTVRAPARLGREELGAAGPEHLGSARRPQAFHLLEAAMLGGARPRHPAGAQALVSDAMATPGGSERDRIYTAIMHEGWNEQEQRFHAVFRVGRAWTPAR